MKKTIVSLSLVLIGVIAGLLWSSTFIETKSQAKGDPHTKSVPAVKTVATTIPKKKSLKPAKIEPEKSGEAVSQTQVDEIPQQFSGQTATFNEGNQVQNSFVQSEGPEQIITTRHYIITQPTQTITQPQVIITSPAQTLNTTVSGYDVPVGSLKSMDYGPVNPHWTMGENGLWQNPPVDPPSTKGRAYRYLQ